MQAVGVLGRGRIDPDGAAVHADDLGFSRGDGCFEATRVVTSPAGEHRIDHLDEHFDRFDRSCAGLQLPPVDRTGWRELVEQLLSGWDTPGEAMLRLMLTRGREWHPGTPVTGIATLSPLAAETLRQRAAGVDVISLSRGVGPEVFRNAPWLLGGVKTLSYAVNVAAIREAHRRGAHDVIFLDTAGAVLEAPTATVVWLADGALRTVPLGGSGVLASITQSALFAAATAAGWQTGTATVTVAGLQASQGTWLVSSGRGVAQVLTLDGTALDCKPGVTEQLRSLAGF
jgi:4-amino-4-deoxychorismate lyase